MITYPLHAGDVRTRQRAREARDFRFMFYLAFPLFLTAGAILRLAARHPKGATRKSVFAEARAAANTCLSYAFMT